MRKLRLRSWRLCIWEGVELGSESGASHCGSSSSRCFLIVSWDHQRPTWSSTAPSVTVKTPTKHSGIRRKSLNIWWVEEPQPRIPSLHLLETMASIPDLGGTVSFSIQCRSMWSCFSLPERGVWFNLDQWDTWSQYLSLERLHTGTEGSCSWVIPRPSLAKQLSESPRSLVKTGWAYPQSTWFRKSRVGPKNLHFY